MQTVQSAGTNIVALSEGSTVKLDCGSVSASDCDLKWKGLSAEDDSAYTGEATTDGRGHGAGHRHEAARQPVLRLQVQGGGAADGHFQAKAQDHHEGPHQ